MGTITILLVTLAISIGFTLLSYFKLKSGTLRTSSVLVLSMISIGLLIATGYTLQPDESTHPNLQSVKSEKNLIKMINEFNEASYKTNFWGGTDVELTFESAQADGMTDDAAGGYAPIDYSKTNTQVEGVDEADIAKTDGRFIYEVGYNEVFIVNAYPEDSLGIFKTLKYEDDDFRPLQLYVDEDYLVVIGSHHKEVKVSYKHKSGSEEGYYTTHISNTRVYVYDKQDQFKQIHTIDLDGSTIDTRKIGSKVYFITREYINPNIIETDTLAPKYTVDGTTFHVDYDDIYFIDQTNPNSFINVVTIDLDEIEEELNIFTVLGSGNNVYMSQENLYIVENQYHFSFLDRISTTAIDMDNHTRTSVITKLKLTDSGTEYIDTAKVEGTIINQFSMDEYKGNFRIVTTKGDVWDDSSENNLYILDESLNLTGKVEGLAKGERIQSSRFVGDRIYMITFKQIDPFFVIDASNPEKPEVLGELKIPGFSTYLHPYDQNHVIGFGFEGNNDGRITGLKMALYDVTDPTDPVEKHKETFLYEENGYTYSDVTYNHKALLFNKQKNILAFPISGWEQETKTIHKDGETYTETVSYYNQSYIVYGLNPDTGFQKRGDISHYQQSENSRQFRIERGIYIEDLLYTVSKGKIQINELDTLNKVDELSLPVSEPNYYDFGWYMD